MLSRWAGAAWRTGVVALATLAAAAHAEFPEKPVTILVQQSAGSTGDLVARIVGGALSVKWKQPVLVDPRPGANGIVASSALARARPDGYTLMMSGSTPLAFNPHLYASLPYDLRRDFTYVAPATESPFVLLVGQAGGLVNFTDFVTRVREAPDKLTFASGGQGNSTHLTMEMVLAARGLSMRHIPFNGVSPAILSVISGETDAMMSVLSSALPQIAAGRVVPIAVSGDRRADKLPDVPTFAELGVQGPPFPGWLVLVGPAGMPPALTAGINRAVNEALHDPAVIARLNESVARPIPGTPGDAATRFMLEFETWGAFIRAHKITIQ